MQNTLLPRLQAAGLKAIDHRDFTVGAPRILNVEHAIDTSRHTLIVMTPNWLDSQWEEFEGLLVMGTDPAGRRRRLIPLLLEPTRLPKHIAMLTSVDLTGSPQQDEEEMQRLLRGLATKSRVFMTFKHGIEPDESLATRISSDLEREGHRVFTDQDVTVGMNRRDDLHAKIALSNYVIVFLSEASANDEVIADHIKYAHLESARTGKARLLPVRVNYNAALPSTIDDCLKDLGYEFWRNREDDERVTRKLLDAMSAFTSFGLPVATAERPDSEAIGSHAKLWPNGSVINIGFLDGAQSLQWKIAKVASEWSRYANLRFVFGEVAEATVRISFKQPGSWSYQGTDALTIPKNQPTVSFGWLKADTEKKEIRRVVLHEFGHVLGLVHEHQVDNARIDWDTEAVYRTFTGPPQNWTKQQVDTNLFQKYSRDYFPIEKEFDPASIMALPIAKELTKDGFEIPWNVDLSNKDKEFVKRLYPSI